MKVAAHGLTLRNPRPRKLIGGASCFPGPLPFHAPGISVRFLLSHRFFLLGVHLNSFLFFFLFLSCCSLSLLPSRFFICILMPFSFFPYRHYLCILITILFLSPLSLIIFIPVLFPFSNQCMFIVSINILFLFKCFLKEIKIRPIKPVARQYTFSLATAPTTYPLPPPLFPSSILSLVHLSLISAPPPCASAGEKQ